jgi:CheY-like chemotaxis protein
MKKKLKCILLVDDDEATNFFHQIIIEQAGCTEHVEVATNGKKAIEFLTRERKNNCTPDIIFLDINMPVMNGWEFLDAYEKLDAAQKSKIVLVMLTASINPDDMQKAEKRESISGFRNKPLSVEMLNEIIQTYFPDCL